jgi:hypothetical protein
MAKPDKPTLVDGIKVELVHDPNDVRFLNIIEKTEDHYDENGELVPGNQLLVVSALRFLLGDKGYMSVCSQLQDADGVCTADTLASWLAKFMKVVGAKN